MLNRENITKINKSHYKALLGTIRIQKNLWHIFFLIRTEYSGLRTKSQKSAQIRENTKQKKTPVTDICAVKLEEYIFKENFFYHSFINPFSTNVPLLYPLKASENHWLKIVSCN